MWCLYRDRNGQRCVLAPSLSLELTALGGSGGYSEGGETAGFHTCARCWLVSEGPVRLYSGCDPRRALGRRQQQSWVWPLPPGSQLQAFKMLLVVCLSSPLVKCKMTC